MTLRSGEAHSLCLGDLSPRKMEKHPVRLALPSWGLMQNNSFPLHAGAARGLKGQRPVPRPYRRLCESQLIAWYLSLSRSHVPKHVLNNTCPLLHPSYQNPQESLEENLHLSSHRRRHRGSSWPWGSPKVLISRKRKKPIESHPELSVPSLPLWESSLSPFSEPMETQIEILGVDREGQGSIGGQASQPTP